MKVSRLLEEAVDQRDLLLIILMRYVVYQGTCTCDSHMIFLKFVNSHVTAVHRSEYMCDSHMTL